MESLANFNEESKRTYLCLDGLNYTRKFFKDKNNFWNITEPRMLIQQFA
jgi:hypothetical protein